ncbi:TPA: DUF3265 domain-containing protein [Vibrio parahaemolyticus]|nr:DUF3265 domain-containing protein [Vibrio parahaemolyticus]
MAFLACVYFGVEVLCGGFSIALLTP